MRCCSSCSPPRASRPTRPSACECGALIWPDLYPRAPAIARGPLDRGVPTSSSPPTTCSGYEGTPNDCLKRTTKSRCLQGIAAQGDDLRESCAWHQVWGNRVTESLRLTSFGGFISTVGYAYRRSECGFRMNVTLPAAAMSRYQAYYKAQGGPASANTLVAWENPDQPFTVSGCTVGKGAPQTCRVALIPPAGYAQDPAFNRFSDIIEFTTTDPKQVARLAAKQPLPLADAFTVTLDYELPLCKTPGAAPGPPTGVKDSVMFGPSGFYTTYAKNYSDNYVLLSYKAYSLTNSTAAAWVVNVDKSLRPTGAKSPMSVMLLREADYQAWSKNCTTKCRPPVGKAIKGTACAGVRCEGKAAGLGASGRYRLLVSYAQASSVYWIGSYGSQRPVDWPYAKQLVTTTLVPKMSLRPPL